MKVQELFEARNEDFMNVKLDRVINALSPKKPGQSSDVKARNAYSRGFRSAFSGAVTDMGVGKEFQKYLDQGIKDGKAVAKTVKNIPPATIVKNSYGDKKPNVAFEKLVKGLMSPYLEKFKAE